MLTSCNQTKKTKTVKVVPQTKDSCNCDIDVASPPPPTNSVISSDTILYKQDNKLRKFAVRLIADKTVDIEGEALQIFNIKAENDNKKESYDFALPTKYNKYWNEFRIYKNTQKNKFTIGFKNTDSNFVHLLYSIYLDTLPFNKGLIRIDFKEQLIKPFDKTN